MGANAHLERALLLLGQSRYDLAIDELRQSLAGDPDNAMAHAVLAICLSQKADYAEASAEADLAVGLAPETAFCFYARSIVLGARNHFPEALASIQEAIGLDPYHPTFFAQLGRLHLEQRRYQQALDAAEAGLALDPEDVVCTNLRVQALVKLGRRAEADAALETALKRDPDDSNTHANRGWSALEAGQPEKAMESFREALRLQPDNEWARSGIVEAMKARYFVYRIVLGWFLWMIRLSSQAQWGVLVGAYVGFQLLQSVARNNPDLAPWILPVLIVYVIFAVSTWVAVPLFNLALRLNRFGRLALSREEIVTSNWVGISILGAACCLGAWLVLGESQFLLSALACAFLIPALSTIYACKAGWPRIVMVLVAMALGGLAGVVIASAIGMSLSQGAVQMACDGVGSWAFLLCAGGTLLSQFGANALAAVKPRQGSVSPTLVWAIGGGVLLTAALLFLGWAGLVFFAFTRA
ncbi:tetratricopeptide repeat protein [Lignipirellula cremea]|uniref:Lipoprotein NlpI n=1 Tax=Lignipirellula cremea TaxID=2528010 RepID=A0A518E0F1_9BACT|nr:tetratricopeptide repeat protein [Lignipirellula cremea]QDU97576.1 lipoprotein NlpI [Lignipirellula cremea]